ncbi:MAG: NADH-quinone oxidoreductase subunit K [Candidatus Micrarchaeaceae archaeon]
MLLAYPIALAVAIFSIGVAGALSSRHFIEIVLAIELIFVASTIALVAFFSAASPSASGAALLLIVIWSLVAAETITFVGIYMVMKHRLQDFDIRKLSSTKW